MSNPIDSLTDAEVRYIAALVETLDRSTFDFLQVEIGNLKVMIGRGTSPAGIPAPSNATVLEPAAVRAAAPQASTTIAASDAPRENQYINSAPEEGGLTIVAPMVGRFYAKPEPGLPPFVSIGDVVDVDTTVALIEIMKVFTAVPANLRGEITEICVQDGQFVEYGDILFRVRPTSDASTPGKTAGETPRGK